MMSTNCGHFGSSPQVCSSSFRIPISSIRPFAMSCRIQEIIARVVHGPEAGELEALLVSNGLESAIDVACLSPSLQNECIAPGLCIEPLAPGQCLSLRPGAAWPQPSASSPDASRCSSSRLDQASVSFGSNPVVPGRCLASHLDGYEPHGSRAPRGGLLVALRNHGGLRNMAGACHRAHCFWLRNSVPSGASHPQR